MLQLPLLLPKIYDSISYVVIYNTHFQHVLNFLLATSLCCNMYGMIICFIMSFSLHNVLNFLELYSFPSSHLISLILFFITFDFLPKL